MLESIILKDSTIEDAARHAIVSHFLEGNNAFLITTKEKSENVIAVLDCMVKRYRRKHVSLKTRMKEFFFKGQPVPFMSNTIWVLEKSEVQDTPTEKFIIRYPECWNGETITLGSISNIIFFGGTKRMIISSEPLMWDNHVGYNQEINLNRKFS